MNYYQKELVRADLIRYVDALKFAIETFEQYIHLKKIHILFKMRPKILQFAEKELFKRDF